MAEYCFTFLSFGDPAQCHCIKAPFLSGIKKMSHLLSQSYFLSISLLVILQNCLTVRSTYYCAHPLTIYCGLIFMYRSWFLMIFIHSMIFNIPGEVYSYKVDIPTCCGNPQLAFMRCIFHHFQTVFKCLKMLHLHILI